MSYTDWAATSTAHAAYRAASARCDAEFGDVYYRVHWSDCPEFCADNAWSVLWGVPRSADGSQFECIMCAGDGIDYTYPAGDIHPCQRCDGTGWADADTGYSCFGSPGELIDYFTGRVGVDPNETVVAFRGHLVGTGADGEPLVVPDQVIRTTTWALISSLPRFLTIETCAIVGTSARRPAGEPPADPIGASP